MRRTVTEDKAYWPLPAAVDKVPYSQIRDIDFTSVATKKRKLDCAVQGKVYSYLHICIFLVMDKPTIIYFLLTYRISSQFIP
jgi:hypothetical protein